MSAGFSLVPARRHGEAEDDRLALDGRGEQGIAVGQRHAGRQAARFLQIVANRRLPDDFGRRQTVGFGEQHIEHDGAGAQSRQSLDKLGQPGARPWPLAVGPQGILVDVDDADRRLDVLARRQALELIKGGLADGPDDERVPPSEGDECR